MREERADRCGGPSTRRTFLLFIQLRVTATMRLDYDCSIDCELIQKTVARATYSGKFFQQRY